MAYENINLFFARDKNNNIVTIDKINKDNKHDDYTCPICGSSVIARTGQVVTHHFAHCDKSQCDSETQIHFWIKNELIKQGDKFKIRIDKDTVKEFVCKEVLIEQQYKTEFGTYKPDITIITESDETIYFEVAKTNKKKLEEYLDQWLELGNIVVEVETKDLINGNEVKEFKALFYDGKCFNVTKEDRDYYETIGNAKIGFKKGLYTKEEVDSINWLWKDMNKYIIGKLDIATLSDEIQSIEYPTNNLVVDILRKKSCNNILKDYVKYNVEIIDSFLKDNNIDNFFNFKTRVKKKVYERIYEGCNVDIYSNNKLLKTFVYMYNDNNCIYNVESINSKEVIQKYMINYLNTLNTYHKYIDYIGNYYEKDNMFYIKIKDYINITDKSIQEIEKIVEYNIDKIKIDKTLKERYTKLLYEYIKFKNSYVNQMNVIRINDKVVISFKNISEDTMVLSYEEYKHKENVDIKIQDFLNKVNRDKKAKEMINEIELKTEANCGDCFGNFYACFYVYYDNKRILMVDVDKCNEEDNTVEYINNYISKYKFSKEKQKQIHDTILEKCINSKMLNLTIKDELMIVYFNGKEIYLEKINDITKITNIDIDNIVSEINYKIEKYNKYYELKNMLNDRYEKINGNWCFEISLLTEECYLKLCNNNKRPSHRLVKMFALDYNETDIKIIFNKIIEEVSNYIREYIYKQ